MARITHFLPLLFAVLVVLLALPRFNRQDPGIIGRYTSDGMAVKANPDSTQYRLLTEYFRGAPVSAQLKAPYIYRPAVPALAAGLPVDAATAVNLVNLGCLLLTLLALYRVLALAGLTAGWQHLGVALYACSFPVLYYGAITYVDPALVCCVTLTTWCLLARRWWALVLLVPLGLLVKETYIFLLPVVLLAVGTALPLGFVWPVSPRWIVFNLHRGRSWAAVVATFGLHGFLSLAALPWLWRRDRPAERARYGVLLAGLACSLLVFLYSITSIFLDGRYIWFTLPFSMPLGLLVLRDWWTRRQRHQRDADGQIAAGQQPAL